MTTVPARAASAVNETGSQRAHEGAAHLVLQHLDGSKCVWVEPGHGAPRGYWWVPYDAGGEGAECGQDHPFMLDAFARAADEARVEMRWQEENRRRAEVLRRAVDESKHAYALERLGVVEEILRSWAERS